MRFDVRGGFSAQVRCACGGIFDSPGVLDRPEDLDELNRNIEGTSGIVAKFRNVD